jgi:hypothetical protein
MPLSFCSSNDAGRNVVGLCEALETLFIIDHECMARGGHELPETAVSGVARPQDGRPAAVFYPFGHPTPYAHAFHTFHSRTLLT